MTSKENFKKKLLPAAISLALAYSASSVAEPFTVTNAQDNGEGDTQGTLSWAILSANDPNGTPGRANGSVGKDIISLQTNVTINDVMKTLIDSDIDIEGNGFTIDGGGEFRPLFIKSGSVSLKDLTIQNGLAKGRDSRSGGAGAGLGGGLFVYSGEVSIKDVTFQDNQAIGGSIDTETFGYGGGGMLNEPFERFRGESGGGLFEDNHRGNSADYGGNGNYNGGAGDYYSRAGKFGGGGYYGYETDGGNGGFGGGGGASYGYEINSKAGGDGGFGGGGGACTSEYEQGVDGGNGGFGGGGGSADERPGEGGFAAGDGQAVEDDRRNRGGDGAGLGGALFVRSGSLSLTNTTFARNSAEKGGGNAQGLGGAIFVLDRTDNGNGNNQGMPSSLPNVSLNGVTYGTGADANSATDHASDADQNDENIYNPPPASRGSGGSGGSGGGGALGALLLTLSGGLLFARNRRKK